MIQESVNVWTLPEIADAQLALVRQQLAEDAEGKPPAPFAAFHRAMRFLYHRLLEAEGELTKTITYPDGMKVTSVDFSLLDVGCGVAHYGVLCARLGGINYFGVDISDAMLDRAWKLIDSFEYKNDPHFALSTHGVAFEDTHFSAFDVVFVSQALEMTADPVASLHLVLERAKKYVLLHRLRVPPMTEPSRRVMERTYLGHTAPNMEWNQSEVEDIAKGYGEIIYTDVWDMSLTMIVEKK